jgi:hypothetical protein
MRNQPTSSRLKAWMFAPLLVVACGQEGAGGTPEFVTVPLCAGPDQVLSTNPAGQLICKPLPPGAAALPDCKKYSQSLTSDGSKVFCTNRNNEAQGTRDALDALEQSEILIKEYQTKLNSLGGPSGPAPRAVYCGQYTAAQNQNGAITDAATGATGIAGAASLCRKVAGCSTTAAKMCTVYDMYHSAATGKLPATLSQSWVWMSEWKHNSAAQVPTANGLADNCSGFTYPTGDKAWYGTTTEWKNAPTGQKALHFASGPGVVGCATRYPIACCN